MRYLSCSLPHISTASKERKLIIIFLQLSQAHSLQAPKIKLPQIFEFACVWVSVKLSSEFIENNHVAKKILRRMWGWIGHTLRKPASSITLTWPKRYCGGSGTGSDTPSGSQHPAPHAKPWPGTRKGRGREASLATVGGETLKQSLSNKGPTGLEWPEQPRTECDGGGSLMAYAPPGAMGISKVNK